MSWDVLLLNYTGTIDFQNDDLMESFPFTNFYSTIENYFPNVKKDGDHREINGPDFAIDYYFSEEPSSNSMLSLHGAEALFELAKLAKAEGWQIFDMAMEGFVDLDNPGIYGYNAHKEYVQQIIRMDNEKPGLWQRILKFFHVSKN